MISEPSSCPRCGTRFHGTFLGKICPRCALEGAGSWEDAGDEAGDDISDGWKIGARVGDYELIDLLGRGGMAVVYLARQVSLDRLVALKTVSSALATESHGRERFRREARAIAQLEHPRIVSIHDVGTSGGSMYYTMDYIAGADLGRAMRSRTIPIREAASIVQKVAEAVAHANDRGVLHRDLKPGNILLDEANEPHVTDFGIALEAEGAASLTLTGDVMGTPPYMAPEALAGGAGKSGPASEVYALGAILFHLLTGRTPFTGTSATEILHLAINASPPSPRLLNAAVPRDLETICLKCLEKSPESRYASAGALADDLRRFLAGENILARPIRAPIRFARWAKRRPALAALWVLLVAGAVAATLAAVAFERSRTRAVHAEAQAREQLFEAQLARAETLRGTKRPGQRIDALAALTAAAKIKVTPALRNAAIASLTQTDLRILQRGPPRVVENDFVFSPGLETVVIEQAPGVLEWKVALEGAVKARLDSAAAGKIISQPAFSPDGRLLLTRQADKSVRLWSLEEGRTLATLPSHPPAEPTLAFDLAWRPDSKEFALARPGGGLSFHSATDGSETRRWENQLAPDIARFSTDGALLAVCLGKKILILDASTLAERAALDLPAEARMVSWHPGLARLAVGCGDGQIRVVDAARGMIEQELVGHRASVLSVGYSPDGSLLMSAAKDTATRLWETRTGETLIVLSGISTTGEIQFSRDGKRAGLPTHDTSGLIAEIVRPTVVREFAPIRPRDTGSLIGAMDFTRDGSRLSIATWGGIEVLAFESGRVLASFPVPEDKREESAAIFANDASAFYTSNMSRGLQRYGAAASGGFDEGLVLDEEKGWLVTEMTADGHDLLLVNRDKGEVKIADTNGKAVRVFNKHPKAMFAALSPDRKWLATQGSGRGESSKLGARVWSLADETLAKEFKTGPLGFVAFSADGRWFAGAGIQAFELARVGDWTKPSAALPEEVAKSNGAIVSFAADGELVAVTANEKVFLIHPATAAERGVLVSPSGNPSTARVRLSPDGHRLAVMWDDASFDLWDLAQLHQELASLGID